MSTDETNRPSSSDGSPVPFMGSLFASMKKSASRGIGQLRGFRQPNDTFTTTAPPPAHTSEPPFEHNNGIVSPSIASNPIGDAEYHNDDIVPSSIDPIDNAEYQNLDASLTPHSNQPVLTPSPQQTRVSPLEEPTVRVNLFGDTPGSSVGIDDDATQKLHWQTIIPKASLMMLLDLEEYGTIVNKIDSFARNNHSTLPEVLRFANRMITRAGNIASSSDIADIGTKMDTDPTSLSASSSVKYTWRTSSSDMVRIWILLIRCHVLPSLLRALIRSWIRAPYLRIWAWIPTPAPRRIPRVISSRFRLLRSPHPRIWSRWLLFRIQQRHR